MGGNNGRAFTLPAECEWESVSGKSVLVTGGTTGIGRTTAKMLASLGAKVLIFGRNAEALEDSLKDIQSVGEGYGLTADQTELSDIQKVFAMVDAKLGGLDILVNNAGESADSILTSDYANWEYVVKTNLLGYMACARFAVERMEKRGGGHIVNIGSLSAKARMAESNVYVATKSGIEGFTDALTKEVGEKNIRVTHIQPGKVGADFPNSSPEEQPKEQAEGTMLKTQDIAAGVFYALIQPARCDVALMQIQPIGQKL